MKLITLLAVISVLCGTVLSAGCGNAPAMPAFTINIEESPEMPPAPSRVTPAARVVLAEVFTYDE